MKKLAALVALLSFVAATSIIYAEEKTSTLQTPSTQTQVVKPTTPAVKTSTTTAKSVKKNVKKTKKYEKNY